MKSILGKFLANTSKHINRKTAIRLKCLDCTGNQSSEVRRCPAYTCPLWRYRMASKEEIPPKDVEGTS